MLASGYGRLPILDGSGCSLEIQDKNIYSLRPEFVSLFKMVLQLRGPFPEKNWVGAWLTRAPCAPRPDGAGSRSDAPARDGSESVFPRGSPGSARRLVLIRCPPSRASAQTWIGSVSSRHRPRLPPRPRSHESESFTFPLQISSRFSLWPVLIKSRSRKWFYLQFVPDQTPDRKSVV